MINVLIKIFIMITLGLILKKKNIIDEKLEKGLSNLLLKVVLPINILASSNNEYSSEAAKGIISTVIFCTSYYLLSIIVIRILTKTFIKDVATQKIILLMVVFANVGFIGFPLVSELYGELGFMYAVIYNMFYQLFFFTYGINLLSESNKISLKGIFKREVTIISFISIAIFLFQIKLPNFIIDTFKDIGAMMVPISMILIGCSLADINIKYILKDKYSYTISFFRLLIIPIFTIIIFSILNLKGMVYNVLILLSALPSGSLNVIFAKEYNCKPQLATSAIIQNMILMISTLPLLIFVINKIQT